LNLSKHLQFQRDTKEQIAAALRYPSFVILAMAVAIVVINIFVLPQFEKVFKGMKAQLPPITEILLSTSRFFVSAMAAAARDRRGQLLRLAHLGPHPGGRAGLGWMAAEAPIVGDLLNRTSVSRFAVSLATALRSGVPVAQSLTIVAQTIGNVRYAEAVDSMRSRVERGESLRTSAAPPACSPRCWSR
jgi:MSHA biogenesis protein MshG